jgi:hypothetical protein
MSSDHRAFLTTNASNAGHYTRRMPPTAPNANHAPLPRATTLRAPNLARLSLSRTRRSSNKYSSNCLPSRSPDDGPFATSGTALRGKSNGARLWCQQKRAMFIPSFDAKHLQWRCCSVVFYSFSFAQALSSCVSFAAIHMPAYLPRNIMTFNDDWWGGRREVEEWQSSVDEGRGPDRAWI